MHFPAVAALLLVRAVVTNASSIQVFTPVPSRSAVLNDSFSVSLFNKTALESDADCLVLCTVRGCAVAVLNETSRLCLMAVINDESSGEQGPDGSHVTRYLGSPDDAAVKVWTAEDFELQLRNRIFQHELRNSSTGRNGTVRALTVKFAGCYRIEAFGAAGGYHSLGPSYSGKGAFASGCFSLAAGTRLEIVVGQAGGNSECAYGAGGGGGSFVYVSNGTDSPQLLVAAGGGGGASRQNSGQSGSGSTSGTNSAWTGSAYSGSGGADGQPGRVSPNRWSDKPMYSCGGSGAGWSGSAEPSSESFVDPGGPGRSLSDGWLGGARNGSCPTGDGGFGGGGAGGGCCNGHRIGAGGGGGGFSGGGAGTVFNQAGGGGGSFCGGFDCATSSGANAEQQGRVRLSRMGAACE